MQKKECWVLDGHQELGHVSLTGKVEEDMGLLPPDSTFRKGQEQPHRTGLEQGQDGLLCGRK